MKTDVLTDLAGVRDVAAEWSALSRPTPMQSPAWLISWWEAFGEHDPAYNLTTLAFRDDDGRLVGLAPWYTRGHSVAGRTLRQLGDGRAASDHGTVICAAEDSPAVVSAAADWLIQTVGDVWRRVRLESIDEDDPALTVIDRLLTEAQIDTERIADVGTFPVALSDGPEPPHWEGYLARLSKNRRKRLRRWRREWFETGRAAARVVTTPAELREAWPTFLRLHNERRHGLGEASAFDCPRFDRFHRLASERLLADGMLYFAVLEIDGEAAAVEYALQDERAVYAYQGGIAADTLRHDAGHLSVMAFAEHAVQTGRTCLDLLRGDEPYKLSWGAVHRPAYTLHARPRDAAGVVERWAGTAYRRVRDQRRWANSQSQT